MNDVLIRVYRYRDDGRTLTKCLLTKPIAEYFYDNPTVMLDMIKRKLGPGRYRIDKYTTDARFIATRTHSITAKCDCSLQRIMLRGCQDPNHT